MVVHDLKKALSCAFAFSPYRFSQTSPSSRIMLLPRLADATRRFNLATLTHTCTQKKIDPLFLLYISCSTRTNTFIQLSIDKMMRIISRKGLETTWMAFTPMFLV